MKIVRMNLLGIAAIALSTLMLASCVETESTRPGWQESSSEYRAARYACENRIRDKIHADRSRVDRVEFERADAWRSGGERVKVQGEGRFRHRDKGWRPFEFDRCPPWRAKRRRVVPGSREATRDTRRAEGAKGDPKGASERGVQSYGRPVCSRNELAILWRNAG